MKFDKIKEIENFIIENEIFENITYIREIYEGGSTYNFYVRTNINEYILKLIPNEKFDMYNRLVYILSTMNLFVPIKIDSFDNYKMLVITFINGRKLRYKNITDTLVKKLFMQYKKMQSCKIDKQYIRSQYISVDMAQDIQNKFDEDKSFIAGLINKYFFTKFKEQLYVKPKTNIFIHGDFTANNILIGKDNNPNLIDFDCLRFGYEIEDFAGLVLQLSGFRGLIGNIKYFKKLYNLINKNSIYSKDDWIYGIQHFYLRSLRRWVHNSNKKKKTIRKGLCFFISLMGYFRLIKFLHKIK